MPPGVDSKGCRQARALRPPRPGPFQPSHAQRQARVDDSVAPARDQLSPSVGGACWVFPKNTFSSCLIRALQLPMLWAEGGTPVTHRKTEAGGTEAICSGSHIRDVCVWVFCPEQLWVRAGACEGHHACVFHVFCSRLPGSASLTSQSSRMPFPLPGTCCLRCHPTPILTSCPIESGIANSYPILREGCLLQEVCPDPKVD